MVRLEKKLRSPAADDLKKAACKLFAERGVDGVTVREIAEAAGQKNHGAVGYHFGSKEELVRDLVIDGAIVIDERRNEAMDALEAAGGPHHVRELVRLLVVTSIDIYGENPSEESYVRFIVMLNMTHRELFFNALDEKWNSGYLRIQQHLLRLMPDMPENIKNQRLLYAGAMLRSVMAMREGSLADTSRAHPMWETPATLEHFIQLVAHLLEAPYESAPSLQAAQSRHSLHV